MDFKEQLMETMLNIVAAPGISGTKSENLASDKIYDILGSIPYFQRNPVNLQKIKVKNDDLGRTFVSALFCSNKKSSKTIILTGHHDVVDVEGCGHLKDLAFSPYEYTKRVKELGLNQEASDDLQSGEWLFGRGVADMKHGLALGIELLREFSRSEEFEGNILFLSVPAEETNSEGMLGAIHHLLELQNSGLEYVGLLLLEPSSCGTASADKMMHTGTPGKINPLFFFAGKETHVAHSFDGLNANTLASEFNRLFELNLDICDTIDGNHSMPPTCLKQMDLKDIYSATTPLYAVSYYNLQTLHTASNDLLIKLREICMEAFENTLKAFHRKREAYEKAQNKKLRPVDFKPVVYTYNELYQEVKKIYRDDLDSLLSFNIQEWKKSGHDIQTIAVRLVKEVFDMYPNKVPMIIIGFAPPFYPSRYPDLEREDVKTFFTAVDCMIHYAKEKYNINIVKNKFGDITDHCYMELDSHVHLDELSSNLLRLGDSYMFPIESLRRLAIPSIVFGGWGKDFHKHTERINIPYSFDVVPDLCRKIICDLFEAVGKN